MGRADPTIQAPIADAATATKKVWNANLPYCNAFCLCHVIRCLPLHGSDILNDVEVRLYDAV